MWLLIKSKLELGTVQSTGLLNIMSYTATKNDKIVDEAVGSM